MREIAEKLEFMNARAVKVCTKKVTGRSPGHKNLCCCATLEQNCCGKGKS
jgi:hypothetical protein